VNSKPLLDIGDKEWHIVKAILQQHVPDREVWAFGSRAKWTAKEFSDLDLAILGDKSLTLGESAALTDAFADSDLPWKVDVVDWVTTSPSFRKIIKRDKVLVQSPSKFQALDLSMSSEWSLQRLDQIAEINPSRKVRKGNVVPFVDMAALPQLSRDISKDGVSAREAKGAGAHFQNGDTLLARITPCLENGKTAQVRCLDNNAIAEGSTEFIVLCGKDPADNDFIYYLCREPTFREYAIGRMEGTSGRQRVSWQSIAAYEFPFPSPNERRAAARVLSALDDRIALLRETNTTLEAIAQALFKSWFVDFDPVHAKMQGRAPEGMDEATIALFPDGFEESELGSVPKGWGLSTVGKAFVLTMGQSPPGDTYNQKADGLPFYQGRTDFGFRFPTKRIYCNAPTRLAEIGDALVSVRAPVGDVNMAIETCCIGRGVAAVRHPDGCSGYTFYTMRNLGERFKNFNSEGTVFGSINKKDFEALPVLEPSHPVLLAFDKFSKALDGRIVINEEQIRLLVELRDALLPRLISGTLEVSSEESLVEGER
jgi:type I restriction enzyme, S subunit